MSKRSQKLPRGISRSGEMYRARIFVDGVYYHLGNYRTITDASAALDIAWGQKARGTFIPPAERKRALREMREKERAQQVTVAQWSELWLQALAADTEQPRSAGTLSSYKSTVSRHIAPLIGDLRLIDVTSEDVDQTIETARSSGQGAARNTARTLRAMFNSAVAAKVGGIETSPVNVKIEKAAVQESFEDDDKIASPEEVRALTAAMPPTLAVAVPIAAWLSLRVGEVLGLQRRDFKDLSHPERATVRIVRQWNSKTHPPSYTEPKRGSRRLLAIPAALVPIIQSHLDQYVGPDPEAPLLPGRHDKARPVAQSALDRHWREARDKIKPGFTFHSLRHTGLSAYGQAGASLKELMLRGGHSDKDAAMVYQRSNVERDRLITSRLNEQIGEAVEE